MISQPLNQFLHQAGTPIIAVDTEQRIVLCNQAACQTFKLPATPLIGSPLSAVVYHPDLLALFEQASLTQMEIIISEKEILYGQIAHLEGLGSIAVMVDVSRRHELENIKSNFVTTLLRDLRSPLTAILGYVELLDRVGPLTEQQHDFVGRIIFSVQSITALLTKALDLEKVEAELDYGREPISMGQIVEYALLALEKRLEQKGLRCEVVIDENLPLVYGNAMRLRQLVANLLDNAVRFTSAGGVVQVELYANSGVLVLMVSDTGLGIPSEEQPYIFERFYRGSNSQDGSGLGLSIVKTIVEQHGGRIWVESQPDKGSTFTVVLPT
jgi:two-component system phosphate regulon sensor histidine kinase PhoR